MPRTKEQNEQLKTERKNMIAECGLKVFCEKSYGGTQMTDIAKKAQISHGLIYHYFKNKEELFDYVLMRSRQSISVELEKIVNSDISNTEKVKQLTDFLINSSIKNKNFPFEFFTLLSRRFQDININGIFEKGKNHKHNVFNSLYNIFEDGEKKGEFYFKNGLKQSTMLYFSIVHGAILGYVLCPEPYRNTFEFLKAETIVEIFTKK